MRSLTTALSLNVAEWRPTESILQVDTDLVRLEQQLDYNLKRILGCLVIILRDPTMVVSS